MNLVLTVMLYIVICGIDQWSVFNLINSINTDEQKQAEFAGKITIDTAMYIIDRLLVDFLN